MTALRIIKIDGTGKSFRQIIEEGMQELAAQLKAEFPQDESGQSSGFEANPQAEPYGGSIEACLACGCEDCQAARAMAELEATYTGLAARHHEDLKNYIDAPYTNGITRELVLYAASLRLLADDLDEQVGKIEGAHKASQSSPVFTNADRSYALTTTALRLFEEIATRAESITVAFNGILADAVQKEMTPKN